MSTRANVIIKSPAQGLFFYYEITSDGYPNRIAPELLKYDGTPESLTDLHMSPGQVGNFDYFYELDVTSGTLKIWDSKVYWQNALADWKEKGYNCWVGKNGRYGWTNWRKSKRQRKFESNKVYRGLIKLVENDQFTKQQLKEAYSEELQYIYHYMKKLRFDPTKIHTWLSGSPDYYTPIYEETLDDQALKINSGFVIDKAIANWRLKVAA